MAGKGSTSQPKMLPQSRDLRKGREKKTPVPGRWNQSFGNHLLSAVGVHVAAFIGRGERGEEGGPGAIGVHVAPCFGPTGNVCEDPLPDPLEKARRGGTDGERPGLDR